MPSVQENTIQQIAQSCKSRREFLDQFIQYLIEEHDIVGGMFWNCSQNPMVALNQHYHPRYDRLKLNCSAEQHQQFLQQARNSNEPLMISAEVQPAGVSEPERMHPTILLIGIRRDDKSEIAELFFSGDRTRESLTAKIAPIRELCISAATYGDAMTTDRQLDPTVNALTQPSPNALTQPSPNAESLDAYVHSLHQSIDLADNAKIIANETRRFLECDRVSVLKVRGRKCEVIAISGQPSVNRRSNTVRMLRKLAQRVLPTRQLFWHPGDAELPPQIETPLNEYLADSSTRSMIISPIMSKLHRHAPRVDDHHTPEKLIGGIVIEHCREQWDRDSMAPMVQIATRHCGDSFRNAFEHQSLLLYSVWKWIGKSKVIWAARNLPKTLAVIASLFIVTAALFFVPAKFQMSCDGTLIPQQRQLIFPQRSGLVSEVLVDHGEYVQAGQTVAKMKDLDLDYQITELIGRIEEIRQTIRATKSVRLNRERDKDKSLQQESLLAQQAELASLEKQKSVMLNRKQNMTINSPLDGQVMTWNVREKLKSRPVDVTDQLMEIANVDGDWMLELDLPDRKVGHFLEAWNQAKKSGDQMKVEFILAADPGVTHNGHVVEVGKAAELNAANEHHLKILVDIDIQGVDVRQSRSGVSAKILCGEESLGYVWLHPVAEFFQAKVLFPIW